MDRSASQVVDRPVTRRRRKLLVSLSIALVLTVQIGMLVFQARVLALQERNLREREAALQRMHELAERVTTGLEKLTQLAQTFSAPALQLAKSPEEDRPIVVLPVQE